MKNTMIKDLLNRWMFGKIAPADLQQWKENIKDLSDEKLGQSLQVIWEDLKEMSPMEPRLKKTVLSDIHQQINAAPRHSIRYWLRIAAVILIPLLISFASYHYFSNKYQHLPQDFVVMAENGQRTKVLLPDGTQVWLNSESMLSYSSDFNENNRCVKLEGEAFFDVNKSNDLHFVVEASLINVVVYGTAFNVTAYPDEETIDITLLRGRVSVENRLDNKLLAQIRPGQQLSLSKADIKWKVQDCDAQIESLWTQNKLKFENAPVSEVFRKLERWYGVTIHVENPVDTIIRYGFTLKSESLREMLDEINKITPIIYKINGEEVIISYK
jgi:ferric-dicitrate binding protein FerR (iron transport regulator)